MFCPKCGNNIPENAAFCPACGAKSEVQSVSAPAPAVPAYSSAPASASPLLGTDNNSEKWPKILLIGSIAYLFFGLLYDFMIKIMYVSYHYSTLGILGNTWLLTIEAFILYPSMLILFALKTRKKPIITAIPLFINSFIFFLNMIINIARGMTSSLISTLLGFVAITAIAVLYAVYTQMKNRTAVIPIVICCIWGFDLLYVIISDIVSMFKYKPNFFSLSLNFINILITLSFAATILFALFTMKKDSQETVLQ